MPDSSDDERDSRTAAAGKKSQNTNNGTEKNLHVEPDEATSSAESHSSESESNSADNHKKSAKSNAPTINWNQGSRNAIRTTLGGRSTLPNPTKPKSAFDSVNDKYFRSRSASISSDEGKEHGSAKNSDRDGYTNGQSKTYFVDDSDASESGEVSEGSESLMLNLRKQGDDNSDLAQAQVDGATDSKPLFVIDSTPNPAYTPGKIPLGGAVGSTHLSEVDDSDGAISQTAAAQLPPQSKAEAFAEFSARYKSAPAVLADLKPKDLEIQARHFFIDSSIHDLDLSMPISCTECLQEGHLALVCPSRECKNCGEWNLHEEQFCPTVRRCQKCREVGHDLKDCKSLLKSSAAETPCDYCGADTHIEYECDKMWKFPRLEPLEGPIKVSISCSYCANKNHLLGDCPLKKIPTTSSTFSIKSYPPSKITNLNVVIGPRKANQMGMQIRGRANNFQPQPQHDDDNSLTLHGPRTHQRPQAGRGKIQFQSGIGQDRNFNGGPPLPRETPPPGPPPFQPRDYRDRDQGYYPRPRSRSPRLPPKPPTAPPKGRGPPSWSGGGARGRGRGRGRDQYRPGRP
ncbi:hypothetical protein BGW36DRAFT_356202 [Talaromyces proteolyticus]|uniref:CCHC-type domain-containing protein n=1 Tax=Talaromyces proteolyticus TaxID=1131652 RepID=A0AAD4L2K5_9EURO|nr:uncharacterized protein BGW36DRAFT_356202 [Talaromyces proteolyticus]KAH8702059.1 hypothetical protein BGW36DRAFT_356202 [Talaromyces proteolyticus]